MKYYLFTYGCQMNKADSERGMTILEDMGYEQTSNLPEADLFLVLACSIRQQAIDRVFGKKTLFGKLRKTKNIITVLSGCVLAEDKPKFAEFFDIIISSAELPQLPNRLQMRSRENLQIDDYLDVKPKYQSKHSVWVPIMNGCNKFCTYCVVPYTRGKEISRSAPKIMEEVKMLIENGVKEITLLGQNVNSYRDLRHNVNFPQLLKMIDEIPGDFWLKFTTSHPYDMSDDLIEVMAQGKHIVDWFHLPVQSGDDAVLKKMNRHYSVAHYRDRVLKAKTKMPEMAISTDIIVGFCGETKDQFEKTRQLFADVGYDMAYLAQYSPRAGTKAYQYADDVPGIEKKKRERILNDLLHAQSLAYNKRRYTDKTVKVLVDRYDDGFCYGRTAQQKHVKFAGNPEQVGNFVSVKITKIDPFHLYGQT